MSSLARATWPRWRSSDDSPLHVAGHLEGLADLLESLVGPTVRVSLQQVDGGGDPAALGLLDPSTPDAAHERRSSKVASGG